MKKYIMIMLLCLVLSVTSPLSVHAEEVVSQENGLDVTFVVDCSGSMKTNDPGGIGRGMVKAFIDTVHSGDIRIGYVAYSDKIVSSVSPVSITDQSERQRLKELIDSAPCSGDTDIGLGVSYAYQIMPVEESRRQIIVLISDGESDLDGSHGRTLEQSDNDLNQCIEQCKDNGILIYTIAFGEYEGSKGVLEKAAAATGGENYTVSQPEALVEVLYGIINNNMSYKIQQFSSGIYAGGSQEIRCVLDEMYLDEVDVLLISSGAVGDTILEYGDKQIPMTNQSYYAVGKIDADEIDPSVHELTVSTSTVEGQSLKVFLFSYRKLTPVFYIEDTVSKNQNTVYQVYFKDRNGDVIRNEEFYKKFFWELTCVSQPQTPDFVQLTEAEVTEGILQGTVKPDHSGIYQMQGNLTDSLGSYQFTINFEVNNIPPSGRLLDTETNVLAKQIVYDLNECFKDADGDELTFLLEQGPETNAAVRIKDSKLLVEPKHSGIQTLMLFVSDGEDTLAYPFRIMVIPLWKAYWWVILLICIVIAAGLWKILYKPKPELQQIAEKKAGNHFAGKLDAYVTIQPENIEEIPPLTFPMYKIRDSRVCLGDLLKEYPDLSDYLGLEQIFLIADEERKMILYHSTSSTVMIGGSIVCRQLQYNVCFGDIIYITSQDGTYEIEIHYIAMIQ